MTAAVQMPNAPMPQLQHVPLSQLEDDPKNPRQVYSKESLAEMAESMKARGVIEPLVVRKVGAKLRIVAGHRRRRAAELAGLQTVPVQVLELSDAEAVEVQLIENLQREDINPLEEAEAFTRLHREFKLTVKEIATKVGKSEGTVYAKLKVAELAPEARKVALEHELPHSHVLLLARLHPKLQLKATKECCDAELSVTGLEEYIKLNVSLDLRKAPFDVKDTELDKKAGACTACPYNLATQADLLDQKPPALCLNAPCYHGKCDADWSRRVKAGEKGNGPHCLSAKESDKVIGNYGGLVHGAPYVELSTQCWEDSKGRTYDQLLGKEARAARATFLARGHDGQPVELLHKDDVKKWLKEAGRIQRRKDDRPKAHAAPVKSEKAAKEDATHDLVVDKVLAAIAAKTEAKEPAKAQWLWVLERELEYLSCGDLDQLINRRNWTEDTIEEHLQRMTAEQLRGVFFELQVSKMIGYGNAGTVATDFGLDLKAIEREAGQDLKLLELGEKQAEKELKAEAAKVEVKKPTKAIAMPAKATSKPPPATKSGKRMQIQDA